MIDQAEKLRNMARIFNDGPKSAPRKRAGLAGGARVITVSSGKGGVGKTNFAVNLAVQLSKRGVRAVVIDADFGLANVEVLLGVAPGRSLSDVLTGGLTMRQVLTDGPCGVKFISGGSGLGQLSDISDRQLEYIMENLSFLDTVADIVIVDTGAGISKNVVNFIEASGEAVLITTPEPTSIADAYSVLRTVANRAGAPPSFKIVVNRAENRAEGAEVYNKLNAVSRRFLNLPLESLGVILADQNVVRAIRSQQPFSVCFPNTPAAKCLEQIVSRLTEAGPSGRGSSKPDEGVRGFVKRLSLVFK